MDKNRDISDEELVVLSRDGDSSAEERLIEKYLAYVRYLARSYFLIGGSVEDLIQEGMIGLLKAVREFDSSRNVAFSAYAAVCIKSKLISALKSASANKHKPLGNYISLETPFSDSLPFAQYAQDPVEHIIGIEAFNELSQAISGALSGFEAKVLTLYLEGCSYQEISKIVSKPQKSVENAITRIRRKLVKLSPNYGTDR